MNGTITPIKTPEQVLAEATNEALILSLKILTHQLHGAAGPGARINLRAQRDLVEAEALRRMAGAR